MDEYTGLVINVGGEYFRDHGGDKGATLDEGGHDTSTGLGHDTISDLDITVGLNTEL